MSLEQLKHEILRPQYIMCNECKKLNNKICDEYKTTPPKEIMLANSFKEKDNKEICKYFEQK